MDFNDKMRPEVRAALDDLFGESAPQFESEMKEAEGEPTSTDEDGVPDCCKGHLTQYLTMKAISGEKIPEDHKEKLVRSLEKLGAPTEVIAGILNAFFEDATHSATMATTGPHGLTIVHNGQTLTLPPPVAMFIGAKVLLHIKDDPEVMAAFRKMLKDME